MGFVTLEVDYFTLKTISRAVLLALTGLLMMIAKNIGTELCRAPTPTPTQLARRGWTVLPLKYYF